MFWPKATQNEVFQVFWETSAWNLSDFFTWSYGSRFKINSMTFFGKSCQNLRKGYKMSSLNLRAKWCIEFSWFFCVKLQQYKGWKLDEIILTKLFSWGFGVSYTKMTQNGPWMRFFKFYEHKDFVLNIFSFLRKFSS